MWTDANFIRWGLVKSKDFNLFELSEASPGRVLQLTETAVSKFITNKAASDENSGLYLAKIWSQIMVRRTYQLPNPKDNSKRIGEDIAGLHTRRVICPFTKEEKEIYDHYTIVARAKLVTIIDGKLVWNRKFSRELILCSTWAGWHFVEQAVTAKTIAHWKSLDNILWHIVTLMHSWMIAKKYDPGFTYLKLRV